MSPEEAEALQKAFVRKRRAWARKICWPYAGHESEPEPGVHDVEDPEAG